LSLNDPSENDIPKDILLFITIEKILASPMKIEDIKRLSFCH